MTETISSDGLRFVIVPVERGKVADTMGEVMRYIRNSSGITVRSDSMRSDTGKLNEHDARFVSWHGQDKKGEVEIHYVIFATNPNDKWVAAYWGSTGAVKKNQAQIDRTLKSVKASANAGKE